MASPVDSTGQACSCPLTIAVIAGISGLSFFLYRRFRKVQTLNVPNFKEDVVYLFQFPTFDTIPCASPFALKLETWLRWQKIPFESIRGTDKWSKYGQIPFIELNGEQIADSNIIIKELQKKFDRNDNLEIGERSVAHAFRVMLDNQTVFSYAHFRFLERMDVFLNKAHFFGTVAKFCSRHWGKRMFRSKFHHHGIGRHSKEEIYQFGIQDIQALSDYLGSKSFMMGEQMTTVDCAMFAHLSEIVADGIDYPHKTYLERECPNLVDYLKRIKEDVWPDWNEVCAKHLYN